MIVPTRIFNLGHKIIRVDSNIPVKILDTSGTIACTPRGGDILVCLTEFKEGKIFAYMWIADCWTDPEDVLHALYPGGTFEGDRNGVFFCLMDGSVWTAKQLHKDLMKRYFCQTDVVEKKGE